MLRLQGFPEEYKIVCNYTQTRKQAGNSLPVPVAQAVLGRVIEACGWLSTDDQPVTDKLIIDGQLRIFEKEANYAKISEAQNCRKIQAPISP